MDHTWRALAQTSRTICIYASFLVADQDAAGPRRSAGKQGAPPSHQARNPGVFSTSYDAVGPCALLISFPSLYLALPPFWAPLGPFMSMRKGSRIQSDVFLPESHVRTCCYQRSITTSALNCSRLGTDWTACIDVFLKVLKDCMGNLCISQVFVSNATSVELTVLSSRVGSRQACTTIGRPWLRRINRQKTAALASRNEGPLAVSGWRDHFPLYRTSAVSTARSIAVYLVHKRPRQGHRLHFDRSNG